MIPILAALALASPDRRDLRPRFRESLFVGSVSSYDRTGGRRFLGNLLPATQGIDFDLVTILLDRVSR